MTTLKKLDNQYVQCRTGHEYVKAEDNPELLPKWQASRTVVRIMRECSGCQTQHLRVWNTITGEILDTRHFYPEGYRIEGGVSTREVRVELIKRLRRDGEL